jgi:tetratricopeptide (TPR) repeat protein
LNYSNQTAQTDVRLRTDVSPEFKDHLNKAIVLRAEGKHGEALEHHLLARDWVLREGSELVKAKYHNGLGNTYEKLSDPVKAYSEYQAALSCANRIEDRGERGIAENNIAYLLIGLNRFDEARDWLDRAEESFKHAGDRINLAQTLDTRASLDAKKFAYRRAVKSSCQSILTLIDWIEQKPLIESLATAERSIRAYRIQLALETAGTVAKAARALSMSRQNLNRILKEEFPELEAYARRGQKRGVHADKFSS